MPSSTTFSVTVIHGRTTLRCNFAQLLIMLHSTHSADQRAQSLVLTQPSKELVSAIYAPLSLNGKQHSLSHIDSDIVHCCAELGACFRGSDFTPTGLTLLGWFNFAHHALSSVPTVNGSQ